MSNQRPIVDDAGKKDTREKGAGWSIAKDGGESEESNSKVLKKELKDLIESFGEREGHGHVLVDDGAAASVDATENSFSLLSTSFDYSKGKGKRVDNKKASKNKKRTIFTSETSSGDLTYNFVTNPEGVCTCGTKSSHSVPNREDNCQRHGCRSVRAYETAPDLYHKYSEGGHQQPVEKSADQSGTSNQNESEADDLRKGYFGRDCPKDGKHAFFLDPVCKRHKGIASAGGEQLYNANPSNNIGFPGLGQNQRENMPNFEAKRRFSKLRNLVGWRNDGNSNFKQNETKVSFWPFNSNGNTNIL